MINETNQLSEREREILRLVATGLSNQQIALQLGISPNTVKVHLRNVFGKINVASRTEATMYAVRSGIVTVDERRVTDEPPLFDAPPFEPDELLPPVDQAPLPVLRETPPPVSVPEPDAPPTVIITNGAQTVQPEVAPPVGELVPIMSPVAQPPAVPGMRRVSRLLGVGLIVASLVVAGWWWLMRPQTVAPTPSPSARPSLWNSYGALNAPRAGFGTATVNDAIFVIGGENQGGVLDSVARFDVGTQSWAELRKKPTPVTDVQAARIGGKLYVPGGRRSSSTQDVVAVVERYDPETDTWTALSPLPAPRSAYALATLEGKLYLFGGWDGSRFRNEVFEYDPAQNRWQTRTAMPSSRGFAQAGVVDDSVFVIGGENDSGALATNDAYTPSQEGAQPWRSRAGLPQPRSRFGLAVPLREIHVFGGEPSGVGPLKYDVSANRWQESNPPPEPIGNQPGVVQNGAIIYVLGGKLGTDIYAATVQGYQALSRLYSPLP